MCHTGLLFELETQTARNSAKSETFWEVIHEDIQFLLHILSSQVSETKLGHIS